MINRRLVKRGDATWLYPIGDEVRFKWHILYKVLNVRYNAALSGPRRGVRFECLVLHSRSAGTLHSPLSAAFPTSGASGERSASAAAPRADR